MTLYLCLCRSEDSLGVPSDRLGWLPLGTGILDLSTLIGMSNSLLPENEDRYTSFSETHKSDSQDIDQSRPSTQEKNIYT